MRNQEAFRQRQLPKALKRLTIELIRRAIMDQFVCTGCGNVEDEDHVKCQYCGGEFVKMSIDASAVDLYDFVEAMAC